MAKAIVDYCRDGAHRLFNGEITGEELAAEVRFQRMPLFEYGAGLREARPAGTGGADGGAREPRPR